MILTRRLVLFVLALYFLRAFCENASALQKTTIAMSTESNYDFGSTENLRNSISYNPGSNESLLRIAVNYDPEFINNFTSYDSESTESPDSYSSTDYESTNMITYESTTENELPTTDFQPNTDDQTSFPSTIDHLITQTTQPGFTVTVDDVTSPNSIINSTTYDSWLRNGN